MITKTERVELKSLVRQQFKVLREEINARRTELIAQAERDVVERYAARDAQWEDVLHEVGEAEREANRRINDALYRHGFVQRESSERSWVSVKLQNDPPDGGRMELRREAHARIRAQVDSALMELNRREADTLRDLAVGALESEEARAFLTSIPTVGDLVPAIRLAELEASLRAEEQP